MENKLTDEELKRMINYINLGEDRVNGAKKIVLENTKDFNLWYRFSTEKSRVDYPSMLGIHTKVGKMIFNHVNWLRMDTYQGMIISLEDILTIADMLLEQELITSEYVKELKQELVNINFGSMKNI